MAAVPSTSAAMAAATSEQQQTDSSDNLESKILEELKNAGSEGVTSEELMGAIGDQPDKDMKERVQHAMNKLLGENKIEMFRIPGTPAFRIRAKKGTVLPNATPEEQMVYSLIEESGKMGIWIRDIRERTGLKDGQLRHVFKSLEGKKLVKSVKAIGTTKKSYVLYGIDADDSLTGGTFYSDQQLDSEFVQALVHVITACCQNKRRNAEAEHKNDLIALKNAMYMTTEDIARYIHDQKVCKVELDVSDVEAIIAIAILDGRLEKHPAEAAYRAVKQKHVTSAITTIPCLYCPVAKECAPGHSICPEQCVHLQAHFDLS